jgi:tetratricopeptide (TPR) repeat protein
VEQGLSAAPGHKQFLEMKAYLSLQQGYATAEAGNWRAALATWSRLGTLGGQNGRAALINTAIAHEKLEEWVEAAKTWREFARRRPRNEGSEGWLTPQEVARLWERISGLYIKAGFPGEAMQTLQTALKYESENPQLLLALARCYVDAERYEAAQNQVDKLLLAAPKHIEALVLQAEISELDLQLGYRRRALEDRDIFSAPAGVPGWEAVLAQNDETYSALARERLSALYDKALGDSLFYVSNLERVKKVIARALEHLPDDQFLRARCVRALLRVKGKAARAEADRQIEQIDLSNTEALHQLIDGLHEINANKEAAALLAKSEALKPLLAAFYAGIGACAVDRGQLDIGARYFEEALKRPMSTEEQQAVPLLIGMTYLESQEYERAETALLNWLKVYPTNAQVHFLVALLSARRGAIGEVREHLREAEKHTNPVADREFRENIRMAKRAVEARPPANLWEIFGPGLSRGANPFGAFDESDESDEFNEFDMPGGYGTFDAFKDLPPMSQRRRRG